MRKFVLIPIVSLGRDAKGHFLEVMSEPASFGGVNFQALKSSGLTSQVALTEQILNSLSYFGMSGNNLYLSNYFLNLSGLKGISLGLTLAAFMQQNTCPYQKIIALGEIVIDSLNLTVSASQYFDMQIAAVLGLGKQIHPLPLYLPADALNENIKNLSQQLNELNIVLKPITTLADALADFGITLHR